MKKIPSLVTGSMLIASILCGCGDGSNIDANQANTSSPSPTPVISQTPASAEPTIAVTSVPTQPPVVVSISPQQPVETQAPVKKSVSDDSNIPTEYKSALTKAQTYNDIMYMSKAGLYDQLTSEYGEQFSEEAAKYAIDNVKADWKENALKKAEMYQNDMAMSPAAIRDQLTSEYGEQFTAEEADYAIANLT